MRFSNAGISKNGRLAPPCGKERKLRFQQIDQVLSRRRKNQGMYGRVGTNVFESLERDLWMIMRYGVERKGIKGELGTRAFKTGLNQQSLFHHFAESCPLVMPRAAARGRSKEKWRLVRCVVQILITNKGSEC